MIIVHCNATHCLNSNQFGFQLGKTTIDAALALFREIKAACNARNRCLVVAIDIKRAFKTVQWTVVNKAIIEHAFPTDL